jgi:D-3-phosphoglycerate dehydrogenase
VSKYKVVISDYVWSKTDIEAEVLGTDARIVAMQTRSEDEFLAEAQDCDALLNTYAGPITARAMEQMKQCKIIARYGIGVDTIDLVAATAAGIIVTNNPSYCVEEVADHTVALLLSAARKTAMLDRQVRSGGWDVMAATPMRRLSATTLGLVGYGNIARQVAVRAAAFGMEVLWSDPYVESGRFPTPGEKVELGELFARSNFVSLHTPLTSGTRGLLNREALAMMRNDAIVINCSRGAVIDQDALIEALDSGRIAGAALDTTVPEPLPADHPLRGRENVLINPHAAWYSVEAFADLQRGAPTEVARVLSGQKPLHIVNPEVFGRSRAGL